MLLILSEYVNTRSSAIAEKPRDASCQLKSCQLPCNSAETTCTTGPENKKLSYRRVTARCVLSVVILPIATQQSRNYIRQVLTKPMVWTFSRRQCVINTVHSTMTRPSRFHCLRCHKQTDDCQVVYITCIPTTCCGESFQSPQCRNCSRDPDHAHLGSTHSSQD